MDFSCNDEQLAIAELAKQNGFIDLVEDGRRKVVQGLTTIEEVLRCGSGYGLRTEQPDAA